MKKLTFTIIIIGTASLLLAAHGYSAVAKAPRAPQPPAPPHDIFSVPAHPEMGVGRTLVVPGNADQTAVAEVEEDLNVMGRILNKAVNGPESKMTSAMGIAIHSRLFGAVAGPQNMYFDGYGAVFVLGVNFPLLPPATKAAETKVEEETSTEWEEARRELYQSTVPGINLSVPGILSMAGPSPEEYSQKRVEELKSDLLEAMKNAVHIRALKADDYVVVVVNGRAGTSESQLTVHRDARYGSAIAPVRLERGQSGEQRLTLKARKSDIEAFQKGKLTDEQFLKKLTEMLF